MRLKANKQLIQNTSLLNTIEMILKQFREVDADKYKTWPPLYAHSVQRVYDQTTFFHSNIR